MPLWVKRLWIIFILFYFYVCFQSTFKLKKNTHTFFWKNLNRNHEKSKLPWLTNKVLSVSDSLEGGSLFFSNIHHQWEESNLLLALPSFHSAPAGRSAQDSPTTGTTTSRSLEAAHVHCASPTAEARSASVAKTPMSNQELEQQTHSLECTR